MSINPLKDLSKSYRDQHNSVWGRKKSKYKKTILEIIESKDGISSPNDSVGTRSLGPWNEYNIRSSGINVIQSKKGD